MVSNVRVVFGWNSSSSLSREVGVNTLAFYHINLLHKCTIVSDQFSRNLDLSTCKLRATNVTSYFGSGVGSNESFVA